MPIRHCQKCGLKVLIDESQGNVNPFYCQRCTAALKSDGAAAAAPTPAGRVTPVGTPQPAGVVTAAGTVKVHCPYCKASFNGRVPQKPAKGQCPLCQKDLILLPTGEIKPAAGFDAADWQKSGPAASRPPEEAPAVAATKETGTRALVKKFAAEPGALGARAKAPAPPPPPPPPPPMPADTDVADAGSQDALPDWMDDGPKPAAPAPSPMPAAETDVADAVRLEDLPPAEPAPPPPPKPAKRPITAVRMAPAPPPPPPEPEPDLLPPDPPPPPPKRSPSGPVKREATERRVRAEVASIGAPQGPGKFLLGLVLVALPLIACPILLNQREQLKGTPIEKLGAIFAKGMLELDARIFAIEEAPKPLPPPPPPPPAASEAPAQPTAEDKAQWELEITKLIEQTNRRKRDLATAKVAETAEQKAAMQPVRDAQEKDLKELERLQGLYAKFYGKRYDPEKQ